MQDLKYYQDKIKEKRMKTPFREFLIEISSWTPVIFYKDYWVISRYPKTKRIKWVLSVEEFEKQRDNLSSLDYNFQKSFFENFSNLEKNNYFPSRITFNEGDNTDYADMVIWVQNVYLSYWIVHNCENIIYWVSVKDNCTNILNWCMVIDNTENCYTVFWVVNSYKIFYSRYISNSNNIWFSTNLIWCSECIFCNNLDNQSYCIKNKKYDKESYFIEKEKILKSHKNYSNYYKSLDKIWVNNNNKNISGSYLINCENLKDSYNCYWVENGQNIMLVWSEVWNKNMYDVFQAGSPSWDDMYWVCWAWSWAQNIFNCCNVSWWTNVFYSLHMQNSSYCIWCIGLKNKSYCILNKQYTKEEWNIMADKIFSSMEKNWTLWDFFPWNINPFYFNDTMAKILWGFSKESAVKDWYMWRDEEIKVDIPEWSDVIFTSPQPSPLSGEGEASKSIQDFQGHDKSWNWKINPEILKKVIKDEKWNYYRIVKMEYNFLVKHSLPLPEIHWMDRMKLNFGV